MKEQTSWPSIFLLLPFYGEEGKEKLDDINVDFGYASKPNFSPIDFQLLNLIYLFYSPSKTCYIYTRIFGLLP